MKIAAIVLLLVVLTGCGDNEHNKTIYRGSSYTMTVHCV